MKRKVTITVEVDPTEYNDAEDTPAGAIELVTEMLSGDADLPDTAHVECEGVSEERTIW